MANVSFQALCRSCYHCSTVSVTNDGNMLTDCFYKKGVKGVVVFCRAYREQNGNGQSGFGADNFDAFLKDLFSGGFREEILRGNKEIEDGKHSESQHTDGGKAAG